MILTCSAFVIRDETVCELYTRTYVPKVAGVVVFESLAFAPEALTPLLLPSGEEGAGEPGAAGAG